MTTLDSTFFLSDPHFFHPLLCYLRGYTDGRKIKEMTPAERDACIWKMNNEMHDAWNAVVPAKGATVYLLGDVALKTPPNVARRFLDTLNGTIRLINGNHEKVANHRLVRDRFDWIKETYLVKVQPDEDYPFTNRFEGKVLIWLSHYSHRVWPHSHYGSLHLYGHSHGNLLDWGRSTDIGWDVWKKPATLREVLGYLRDQVVAYPVPGLTDTWHHHDVNEVEGPEHVDEVESESEPDWDACLDFIEE